MTETTTPDLVQQVLAGNQRATARLMRLLDDRDDRGIEYLKALYSHTGHATIVGVTGPPGAGKSTLTSALIAAYRAEDKKVGVVAVDPTSPFSGGTILGDRIRMHKHETDKDVFIRSVATRGSLGGLSRSTADIVKVLDAYGCDIVIVETVGVGQDEVDIVREADTSIVVVVPGMGDDVQAIKAGILEVADIFVINKADRPGADQTERDLKLMIELGAHEQDWKVPILRTIATKQEGVTEVCEAIANHTDYLASSDQDKRKADQVENETWLIFQDMLINQGLRRVKSVDTSAIFEAVRNRELDPYSAGQQLLAVAQDVTEV